MTQRDAVFVFAGIVLATAIAAVLLVGSMTSSPASEGRPRFFVDFAGRTAPSPRPIEVAERDVPVPFRPVIPFQRGVSQTARDAAGYLLVLLGVAATLVLGRDQVLATYHAARGGWRAQLRVFGTGVAVLVLLASAGFLSSVVLLSSITTGFRQVPLGIQFGLQIGLMASAALSAFVLIVALVGFTAASWRLGDALFGSRALVRWGQRVPPALVALIGATLLYLLAQVPVAGAVFAAVILAYALGAVIMARLGHASNGAGASSTL
jgi:hypothetical protein